MIMTQLLINCKSMQIPVHLFYDGSSDRLRIDTYAGLDSTLVVPDESNTGSITFNLFPRITVPSCWKIDNPFGPTQASSLKGIGSEDIAHPLPDLSTWDFAGTAKLPGV